MLAYNYPSSVAIADGVSVRDRKETKAIRMRMSDERRLSSAVRLGTTSDTLNSDFLIVTTGSLRTVEKDRLDWHLFHGAGNVSEVRWEGYGNIPQGTGMLFDGEQGQGASFEGTRRTIARIRGITKAVVR